MKTDKMANKCYHKTTFILEHTEISSSCPSIGFDLHSINSLNKTDIYLFVLMDLMNYMDNGSSFFDLQLFLVN